MLTAFLKASPCFGEAVHCTALKTQDDTDADEVWLLGDTSKYSLPSQQEDSKLTNTC